MEASEQDEYLHWQQGGQGGSQTEVMPAGLAQESANSRNVKPNMPRGRYQANFTKASLLIPESRIVAGLLLKELDEDQWHQAIVVDNVLQKRTKNTAMTQASLIRNRLITMGPELWSLVSEGGKLIATHAVLAATIKFSPLLGDFMDLVIRDQFRRFEKNLRPPLWDEYLEGCHQRDPDMPAWSESTRAKLKQNAFRMMAEAGYLHDTRSMRLQRVQISPEVIDYLKEHKESYVMKCLQVSR